MLVSDIDVLSEQFFRIREQGDLSELGITSFDFDNVTFVLDVLDKLAGDERFMEIRKRRPKHRTLTRIDEAMADATRAAENTRKRIQDEFEETRKKEEKVLEDSLAELKKEFEKQGLDAIEALNRVGMVQKTGQRRIRAKMDELEERKKQELDAIQTRLNLQIRREQNWYKFWAVALPPIPPLALAVVVLLHRRKQEREGVARTRLRG